MLYILLDIVVHKTHLTPATSISLLHDNNDDVDSDDKNRRNSVYFASNMEFFMLLATHTHTLCHTQMHKQ